MSPVKSHHWSADSTGRSVPIKIAPMPRNATKRTSEARFILLSGKRYGGGMRGSSGIGYCQAYRVGTWVHEDVHRIALVTL